jgi:hypothetical protein
MKKSITLLLTAMTVTISFGQITTTKVAPKVDQVDNTPYDSTENYAELSPMKYVGQELYLKGKAESLRKYGYADFVLDYNKSTLGNNSNIYKCCESYNSKYDDLNGKYFKVLDVIKHPKATSGNSTDDYLYGKKWFLKLQEKESGDIVYFQYSGQHEHAFPFIVVGFFEKQKKRVAGMEFIFSEKYLASSTEITTGKPISKTIGQVWKCVDLTIDEKYYNLSLIVENTLGEKTTVSYDGVFGKYHLGRAYTVSEAASYRKLFGSDNFDLVLQGKVKIGFTKEMCRLSWGEPKDINETITSGKKSEQWVYDKNYLYFDNGVVTAMQ